MQEVTGREDSESYAKRTITEIETCLGFTFHGADGAEEAPAESISTNELEVSRLAWNDGLSIALHELLSQQDLQQLRLAGHVCNRQQAVPAAHSLLSRSPGHDIDNWTASAWALLQHAVEM